MAQHDSHYHRLADSTVHIEVLGTVQDCPHCTPTSARTSPAPAPIARVPAELTASTVPNTVPNIATHASNPPVTRRSK